jgi:hypothetical protein
MSLTLQVGRFRAPRTRGIERHQQDAMKEGICSVDQTRDLLRGEYLRKVKYHPRIGGLCDAPVPLQYLDVKESHGGQPQAYGVGAELELGEQRRLIPANVLRA